MGMNTIVMLENSDGTSGLDEKLKGTGGAAHVRPISGTGQSSSNRYLPSVDETHIGAGEANNRATWVAGDNVTELTITNLGAVIVLVVFDKTDADAATALGVTGDTTTDIEYYAIGAGETRSFTGTSYFTSADFERVAVEDTGVLIGAQ